MAAGSVLIPTYERAESLVMTLSGVAAQTVTEIVRETGAPDVASARLFDLYRGDQVPDGKKSLAYTLRFRASDRTLTDEEADAAVQQIVAEVGSRFGATVRGG